MNINSVSIHFVRNEYEYNKYLSYTYKEANAFVDIEASLPIVVIEAEKQEFGEIALLCDASFSPEADMTNFVDTDDLIVSVDKHSLSINFANVSQVVLSVIGELGLTELETTTVTLTDPDTDESVSSEVKVYTTDELLSLVDETVEQQGNPSGVVLLEMLIASQAENAKLLAMLSSIEALTLRVEALE